MELIPECQECRQHFFRIFSRERKPFCGFVGEFLEDIQVCPKQMSIEELRRCCEKFVSPEDFGTEYGMCFFGLSGSSICPAKEIEDLPQDPNFRLRINHLTKRGKERRLHGN